MENNATTSTPGPWEQQRQPVIGAAIFDIYPQSGGEWIAEVNGEANARLIAAAPDLLEAAQVAYGVLCSLSYLKAVQKSDDYEELNRACELLAVAANQTVGE